MFMPIHCFILSLSWNTAMSLYCENTALSIFPGSCGPGVLHITASAEEHRRGQEFARSPRSVVVSPDCNCAGGILHLIW